jgi:hypothetical protein
MQHPSYNIKNTKDFVLNLIETFKDGQHPLYDGVIIDNIWELISELKMVFEQLEIKPPTHIVQRLEQHTDDASDKGNSGPVWKNLPGINLL